MPIRPSSMSMPQPRRLSLLQQGLLSRQLPPVGRTAGLLVLGLLGILGCGHDTTGPAPRDPAALPWTLTLNHYAVTLSDSAPYDTVQLTATARTVGGTPLSGAVVRYTTTDPSSAVVDTTTGLVTARGATNQVLVVASATVADVTVADTVAIRVNDVGKTPTLPARLVLSATQNQSSPLFQPIPSAGDPLPGLVMDCEGINAYTFATMRSVQLATQVTDAGGTDLTGEVVLDYRSSDPGLLAVGGPVLTPQGNSFAGQLTPVCAGDRVGPVWITATATAYGRTVRDSVRVTMIPSLRAFINVLQRTPMATQQTVNYFAPGTVTIGVGGIVLWKFAVSMLPQRQDSTIDVVFDVPNPAAVARGVDTLAMWTFPIFRMFIPYPYDAAGGNIAPFTATTVVPISNFKSDTVSYRARQFPVAGTYPYHSARYHTTGTIIVRPWTTGS